MTSFESIKKVGFHADLLERLVQQLNGGELPEHSLFRLETAFDDEAVFRHFDYLGLRGGLLTSVHIDELPIGVRWYANLSPVSKVSGVELGQSTVPQSAQDAHPDFPPAHVRGFPQDTDLTVIISMEGRSMVEMDPMHCDDPDCTADHGMMGSTKDEGLMMTFSDTSENSTAEEAMTFLAALSKAMTRQ